MGRMCEVCIASESFPESLQRKIGESPAEVCNASFRLVVYGAASHGKKAPSRWPPPTPTRAALRSSLPIHPRRPSFVSSPSTSHRHEWICCSWSSPPRPLVWSFRPWIRRPWSKRSPPASIELPSPSHSRQRTPSSAPPTPWKLSLHCRRWRGTPGKPRLTRWRCS